MNKIIIEDNIPLPNNDSSSNYKKSCLIVMSELEIGQSFLIYGRSESTIKHWIKKVERLCSENQMEELVEWRNERIGNSYAEKMYNRRKEEIDMFSKNGKNLLFQCSVVKSEKPTTKIHNNQLWKIKCKQYPIRVWRIK